MTKVKEMQLMITGIRMEVGQDWKEDREGAAVHTEQAAAVNVGQAAAINVEQAAAINVKSTNGRQELESKAGPSGQEQSTREGCKQIVAISFYSKHEFNCQFISVNSNGNGGAVQRRPLPGFRGNKIGNEKWFSF